MLSRIKKTKEGYLYHYRLLDFVLFSFWLLFCIIYLENMMMKRIWVIVVLFIGMTASLGILDSVNNMKNSIFKRKRGQ